MGKTWFGLFALSQGNGIGTELLKYGMEKLQASHLWALEKNHRAIKFYQAAGFALSGERVYEEGTTEHLVHLIR